MSKALLYRSLKGMFMSALGAGTIGLTTHLINQSKPSELLKELKLDPKPEIEEEELEPKNPPGQVRVKASGRSDAGGGSSDDEDSAGTGDGGDQQPKGDQGAAGDTGPQPPASGAPDSRDTQESQSSPPAAAPPVPPPPPTPAEQNGGTPDPSGGDPNALPSASDPASEESDIVEVIKNTVKVINEGDWVNTSHQLGTVHSIVTNVKKLNEALETWKKLKAAGTDG